MDKNAVVEPIVRFSHVKRFDQPYKYFHTEEVFAPEAAQALLKWIESSDKFIHKEENFYRNSWFNISSKELPDYLKDVFSLENLTEIKKNMERIFETSFLDEFLIFAQKYSPGEGTLIHTDYMEPENRNYQYFFTHRMIVYLNHGWKPKNGGLFGVFSTSNPKDIVASFEPFHNTAVGLAHGPESYHAVSAVSEEVRYAIQFSFLSKELKYEGE